MDFPKNKRRWNWRKFHNNGKERSTKYNSYLWSLNVAKQAFRRRILMISISFEMLLFMWWIWKRSSVCFVANFIVDCEVFHYSHYSSFSPLCFWRKSLTCWVFEISFASRLLWNQEYKLPNGNSSLKYFFWFRFGVSLVFKGIEMYHERSLLCKILNTFLQFLFSSRITSINIDTSVNHFMRRCMFARSILWFWHHQDFNMNRFICRREENYLYWQ